MTIEGRVPKDSRYFICILLTLVCGLISSAQQIYVVDDMKLKKMNIGAAGCTYEDVYTTCMGNVFSIAISNDTLYYVWEQKLYKAVRQNDVFTGCTEVGAVPNMVNSLTVGDNGMLYYVEGSVLHRMDPRNGSSSILGILPFNSAGDLIYYKANLYLASYEGIVKINTATPTASTLFIATGNSKMYGMASVPVDCYTNRVFGLIADTEETTLIEIDMENQQLLAASCVVPLSVMDAASVVENGGVEAIEIKGFDIAPDCNNSSLVNLQVLYYGSGTYVFSLQNGAISHNGFFPLLAPGDYNLKIVSANGCAKDSFFKIVPFPPRPVISANIRQPNCERPDRTSFNVYPAQAPCFVNYRSEKFSINHVFEDLGLGEHRFVFTDPYGCRIDSTTVRFDLAEKCDTLYFPTAFTPNEDGVNDVFKPGPRYIKDYRLRIFNRYGQEVFQTNSVESGWDGMLSGRKQSTSTFVYTCTFTTVTGKQKFQKGQFVLIR